MPQKLRSCNILTNIKSGILKTLLKANKAPFGKTCMDQTKIKRFQVFTDVLLAMLVIIAHHKFWIKDSDIRRKGIG